MKFALALCVVFLVTLAQAQINYNYGQVLGYSIQFYEANRCGRLPANNRITYRGDSFLDDGQREGVDLVGGYFDAGDHVKFGFPMAGFTTLLNWGLLTFRQGYVTAGELNNGLDTVKWSLDYFIKAHVAPNELYGQSGDGHQDHSFWGRPEDWPQGPRQSWKITQQQPGSELAGETAAAMASGYLVFRDVNATYAATLLTHARQLYDFAKNFRGDYTGAIPAGDFYNSWSGYGDELGWAAAWMYRATNETMYLNDLDGFWTEFNLNGRPSEFGWDNKVAGVQILMAALTGQPKYVQPATAFCDWVVNTAPKSPKGMVFLSEWGALRHAGNVAFACLTLADAGVNAQAYRTFARGQIGYALGDTGRSFVCGFGVNPPVKPHHRSSSCPNRPASCDNGLNNPGPNPQTLTGALVGGPGLDDSYVDDRNDYVKNEVATDYNAGFQGALAALVQLQARGEL
jgi:endoglucanase